MKVLIIDPWCSDDYEVYTIGLCDGLSKIVDTTLISAFNESRKGTKYKIIPVFFKNSDRISKRGKIRSIIRGIEYVINYFYVLKHVKRNDYDIIHIEWALSYKIDVIFDRLLKKYCKKLVYTAHNVIPHINGEKFIDDLRKIHNNFDVIVVHGERIRKEYFSIFPEDVGKVFIQRHGVHLTQKIDYNVEYVDKSIVDFINQAADNSKLVICIGAIYYNKGTDRVLRYWDEKESGSDNRLIVAGKVTADYKELTEATAQKSNNVLFLPRYLNDDEYAYVLSKADLVTIPYRDASMSGIVYSAAAFSKPIVYTDTGAISEYVGEAGGFVSDNSYNDFAQALRKAIRCEKSLLCQNGEALHDRIYNNYNWDEIAKKLLNEIYMKG